MPHTTATTTAAKLPSGGWEGMHIQNLGTVNVWIGREATVTSSGATGGLKLVPDAVLNIRRSNGFPGTGGPYVKADTGTATVAWELFL